MPLADFRSEVKSVHSKSVLASRLYQRPEIQKLYLKTINELLADHWNEETLIADIDQTVELIGEHVLPENRGFRRGIARLKAFIRGRRATVAKDFESGVANITLGARTQLAIKIAGSAEGTFSTRWTDETPENPAATGETQLEVVEAGKPMEFSALGVSAEPSNDRGSRASRKRSPPAIVFHGLRKPNNRKWMMKLIASSKAFQPSSEPAAVSGVVIEGNPWWFLAKLMLTRDKRNLVMTGGTVTFDQAKREAGAPVSGTVKVEFGSFQGGDHMTLR